ncbi:MAG TPA: hypothetical protein VKN18_23455 [Blastocatellia bacterium]|nr:hypothetical protein [Blastocatellia bacterium]
MRGNLRFALTALTWAVILLAIYAITARAQTRGPLHSAGGVVWAARAGAPGLPVLRGGCQANRHHRVTTGPITTAFSGTSKSAFTVTRGSL